MFVVVVRSNSVVELGYQFGITAGHADERTALGLRTHYGSN